MALHRLTSITMGVPNVAETAAYYTEFGLTSDEDGWFSTRDGGRQLRIVPAPTRRLVDVHIGVDDADDLVRAADNLHRIGVDAHREPQRISAVEKATGTRAYLEIAARLDQRAVAATCYNGPGRYERSGQRAPGVLRTERVLPRKLGHAVLGSTDYEVTQAFFVSGLGFKISDHIKGAGAFLRCSIDHRPRAHPRLTPVAIPGLIHQQGRHRAGRPSPPPRMRSISASAGPGTWSPRQAMYWSGRTSIRSAP